MTTQTLNIGDRKVLESTTNIFSLNKVLAFSDNYLENWEQVYIQITVAIVLRIFILVITI
jgi:hypothetical protein